MSISELLQLNKSIIESQKKIDFQISILRSFLTRIDDASKQADKVFGGSGIEYGIEMIDQFLSTKDKIENAISMLESAKAKLQMINLTGGHS